MNLNNNNTTITDFNNVRDAITNKYPFNKDNIKGIFVKKLPNADVLIANKSENASGNTTHIACTTQSINFFYTILGEIAFNQGLSSSSTFDINVETLYTNASTNNDFINSKCTIWKVAKLGGDQIGLSKLQYDGDDFRKLRESMFEDDMIIFFKYITSQNTLENYIILLKHDNEADKKLIENIVGPTQPSSFTKYYEKM